MALADQYSRTGVGEDGWPEPRKSNDGCHQEHYFETQRDRDALGDVAHHGSGKNLRSRLDALVAADAIADRLYEAKPFSQRPARYPSDKFWMVSHPVAIDDHGVIPLMERWGGEVASFWVSDATLSAALARLGRPRIVEIAVPLEATPHTHAAGKAVAATFGRSRGVIPEKSAFDLYVTVPLPAAAVLAVHTEHDATFTTIGRTYPAGFVDVAIGRWKELTGEDD